MFLQLNMTFGWDLVIIPYNTFLSKYILAC